MKFNELLEATSNAGKHPVIQALAGKTLDWDDMRRFIASHGDVFEVRPNGSAFAIKKSIGVGAGPILTAMRKACSDRVKVLNLARGMYYVEWPSGAPIDATIVLDQPVLKVKNVKGREQGLELDEYKKAKNEQWIWANKNAKEMPHDKAAKGWYIGHNTSDTPVYGRFEEGPAKGDLFRTEHFAHGEIAPKKKGDKIRVTADPTYGRVKIVKD
jgi:hypothetical protein